MPTPPAATPAASPEQQSPSQQNPSQQNPDVDLHAETPSSPPNETPVRIAQLAAGRGAWALVAVLCIAAGVFLSLLGARSVARTDAAKTRQEFRLSSTGTASTLKLALQHEEDLVLSASTFFASNPKTSHLEFNRWANWARAARRYPELANLGLITLVHASELAAFETRITGRKVKAGELHVVPTSDHQYYCLTLAELATGAAGGAGGVPAGYDYCAKSSSLLLARDEGHSTYARVSAGGSEALEMETPVYRGGVTPISTFGREAASAGWLRAVLVPGVVLQQALQSYPGNAASLRFQVSPTNVVFTSGTPQPGGQSSVTSLRNGWTVKSFGAPVSTGVLSDSDALALLIVGALFSLMLGLLIYVLGAGRPAQTVQVAAPAPAPPAPEEVPDVDLYDTLTGLPNRALTLDRAECMVARAGRQSGMLAGSLFIDIDWLKDVNEKLGQAAGDRLLKIVAERLEGVIRTGDTVGRLGGDEFVVLVESAARGVRLDSLARRVIEALHKPVELEGFGPSFFFTASIGVAFGRYTSHEDLLRDAQLALYAAKAAGKDRYTLFNANMRSVIEGRGVLEDELNTALAQKQFVLHYEPIYDLTTRKVVALEAGIRWMHPKQGTLAPADFIPMAEETGLIVPIGRWALEEACSRVAAWNVAGHQVGISVKVSDSQLERDGFVTDVRRALQQSGIEPARLMLEIDESTIMRDAADTVERLKEIRQLGARVAVDDFGGSGYARHSDLQRMPLDCLKVDRSSLAAAEDEDYRTWLLEAILVVGREQSLAVIATGIETPEQLSALQTMGCTMAQGSLFGEPTPTDGVEGLFGADFPAVDASQNA